MAGCGSFASRIACVSSDASETISDAGSVSQNEGDELAPVCSVAEKENGDC